MIATGAPSEPVPEFSDAASPDDSPVEAAPVSDSAVFSSDSVISCSSSFSGDVLSAELLSGLSGAEETVLISGSDISVSETAGLPACPESPVSDAADRLSGSEASVPDAGD